MGVMSQLDFVKNEIKEIPDIDQIPHGEIEDFSSRVGYALSLGLKEKIFLFVVLLSIF